MINNMETMLGSQGGGASIGSPLAGGDWWMCDHIVGESLCSHKIGGFPTRGVLCSTQCEPEHSGPCNSGMMHCMVLGQQKQKICKLLQTTGHEECAHLSENESSQRETAARPEN